MATVKVPFTAKFKTSKDADTEETSFAAGDPITVVQKWARFVLIKDKEGHFYNIPPDKITL